MKIAAVAKKHKKLMGNAARVNRHGQLKVETSRIGIPFVKCYVSIFSDGHLVYVREAARTWMITESQAASRLFNELLAEKVKSIAEHKSSEV